MAAAEPAAVPQATFEATPAAAEVVPAAAAAPEAAAAPAPSKQMLDKLRKQIEYYFGDANFRNDKFLKGKANEDADGFVGLSVLLTFNRIKALGVGEERARWHWEPLLLVWRLHVVIARTSTH